MKNGKITDIECIVFNEIGSPDMFKYSRDIFLPADSNTKNTAPIIFKIDTCISKEWDKYILYYKKLYGK